jgi:hypothetical protein
MSSGLNDLPEPAHLHAWLSANRSLDWGGSIPTKAEIAAEYGADATIRSLTLLARAAQVEQHITGDFESSIDSGAIAYQLANRLKSPQSLARKILKLTGTEFDEKPLDDVVRYTLLTPEPDNLVPTAVNTSDSLTRRGWEMNGALHSYASGSRYKGLHLFLQTHGERVEVQIHSRESIDVKERTTPLYVVERDSKQPREARNRAREAAIALSDRMRQPAGIDDLPTLGGVPVEVRIYGGRRRGAVGRGNGSERSPVDQCASNSVERNWRNGMSR